MFAATAVPYAGTAAFMWAWAGTMPAFSLAYCQIIIAPENQLHFSLKIPTAEIAPVDTSPAVGHAFAQIGTGCVFLAGQQLPVDCCQAGLGAHQLDALIGKGRCQSQRYPAIRVAGILAQIFHAQAGGSFQTVMERITVAALGLVGFCGNPMQTQWPDFAICVQGLTLQLLTSLLQFAPAFARLLLYKIVLVAFKQDQFRLTVMIIGPDVFVLMPTGCDLGVPQLATPDPGHGIFLRTGRF